MRHRLRRRRRRAPRRVWSGPDRFLLFAWMAVAPSSILSHIRNDAPAVTHAGRYRAGDEVLRFFRRWCPQDGDALLGGAQQCGLPSAPGDATVVGRIVEEGSDVDCGRLDRKPG